MQAARTCAGAGLAAAAMIDPALAWRIVLFGGAVALVVSLCWLMATGRSW